MQAVGPERFGIVSVDCAKARSKWMLADFYGRVVVPPTVVEHTRPGLQQAVDLVRLAAKEQGLQEVLVSVERTGNYHRPVQRAFAAAGFETRVVHPFATKQFRQPANPGDKTDDHDLTAIHRATVTGFGLIEAPLDEAYRTSCGCWSGIAAISFASAPRSSARSASTWSRRSPGFAALFGDSLWVWPLALAIVRRVGHAERGVAHGARG